MSVRFSDRGFDAAEKRLKRAGLDCVREGAAGMQREAQRLAPVDYGNLRRGIVLIPQSNAALVVSEESYSAFVEYGTGQYGERPGRQTPWVYVHPRYGFVTTTGQRPQPFFRPALEEGVSEFRRAVRGKGL